MARNKTEPSANFEPTVSLKEHLDLLRLAEEKFLEERDRRYTEVKAAEEKAIKIKEMADEKALSLAREIQTYKDEKANELREQINSERGLYVTQAELKPISQFVASEIGSDRGALDTRTLVFALFGVAGVSVGILAFILR